MLAADWGMEGPDVLRPAKWLCGDPEIDEFDDSLF